MSTSDRVRTRRGSRHTKQRQAILDVLRKTRSHPTAEWIHQEVRKDLPRISLGTVYRNLKILRDRGEILELSYGPSLAHYDGFADEHYHVRCVECDRLEDLEMPVMQALNKKAATVSKFSVDRHRLEFEGVCPQCLRVKKPGRTR